MRAGQLCGRCNGRGGTGGKGKGRGGRVPEEKTAVGFKTQRTKVKTTKGAIIGQFLIDGEQVRGEVSSTLRETVIAAEREASDLIHRDRYPRQYHKAIKGYFSNLKESRGASKTPTETPTETPTKRATDDQ